MDQRTKGRTERLMGVLAFNATFYAVLVGPSVRHKFVFRGFALVPNRPRLGGVYTALFSVADTQF